MDPSMLFKSFLSYLIGFILLIIFLIEIVPFYADMLRGPNAINFMVIAVIIFVAFIIMSFRPIAPKKKVDGYKVVAPLVILGIIAYIEVSSPTYMNLANDMRSSMNSYISSYFGPYAALITVVFLIVLCALSFSFSPPISHGASSNSKSTENRDIKSTTIYSPEDGYMTWVDDGRSIPSSAKGYTAEDSQKLAREAWDRKNK